MFFFGGGGGWTVDAGSQLTYAEKIRVPPRGLTSPCVPKVSEYDQEKPQSYTADQPLTAPWERDTEHYHPLDIKKTTKARPRGGGGMGEDNYLYIT